MKRVAIVGTGIAGMACARELHGKFELTIYEKNDYVGGHTHTVSVDEEGAEIPVDTGFMVYNETTYPELTRLFARLGVGTRATSMSFSVQHAASGLEFAGTGMGGLFAQPRNALKPGYWRFLSEISRFNEGCSEVLADPALQAMTLGRYCALRGYGDDFRDRYLIPMSAAVWSAPHEAMLEFPVLTLVRFFTNHRFLSLHGQLEWRTVVGGSRAYRDILVQPFLSRIRVGRAAARVERIESGAIVTDAAGISETFDAVVLACHADEALKLLSAPSRLERELLSRFRYQANRATLHSDDRVMPRAKRAWASWNYRADRDGASTVYWMNRLQGVSRKKNYFVSINDPGLVDPSSIHKALDYDHPLYTLDAIAAQERLPELNAPGPVYFAGSYFKYGFHEDALVSGLATAGAVAKGHA
jgi:predicted NAD/FAD-binding protein